jgi:hypothetical protein
MYADANKTNKKAASTEDIILEKAIHATMFSFACSYNCQNSFQRSRKKPDNSPKVKLTVE